MNRIYRFALLCAIVFPSILFGQKNFFKEAEKRFADGLYWEAIELYKSTYRVPKKQKWVQLYRIGLCYLHTYDYKQAEIYFQKAIKARYDLVDSTVYLDLAYCQKVLGKYDEASVQYNLYMNYDSSHVSGIKSCLLAQKWIENPTRYSVENTEILNSLEWEQYVSFSDSTYKNLFFITSAVHPLNLKARSQMVYSTGHGNGDFYMSTITDTGLSVPLFIPNNLNNSFDDNHFQCLYNGKILFTRGMEFGKHNYRNHKQHFYTYKLLTYNPHEKEKKKIQKLEFCFADSGNYNFVTAFAIEENDILFSSDMPGGYGGYDLWRVQYDSIIKGWAKPVNLGPEINSSADEKYPYVRMDGNLYFSSNRIMGIGGYDIFRASSVGDGKWGKTENMQCPINSSYDDWGIVFEGEDEKGYLISNRPSGKGGFDIYNFELPPVRRSISGSVKDVNGSPVGNASVILECSSGKALEVKTDDNGNYTFEPWRETDEMPLLISVSIEGYPVIKSKVPSNCYSLLSNYFRQDFILKKE